MTEWLCKYCAFWNRINDRQCRVCSTPKRIALKDTR